MKIKKYNKNIDNKNAYIQTMNIKYTGIAVAIIPNPIADNKN